MDSVRSKFWFRNRCQVLDVEILPDLLGGPKERIVPGVHALKAGLGQHFYSIKGSFSIIAIVRQDDQIRAVRAGRA